MKYLNTFYTVTVVLTSSFLVALPVNAENIKVTPLGSHYGEFCNQDRALIFEDPNGTRILYDPGRTVTGATDKRLGEIHVVLVTHMHGDHVGDWHYPKVNSGKCGDWPVVGQVDVLPNTNAVNIALAKKAEIVTGSEKKDSDSGMPNFFKGKLGALDGGDPEKSKRVKFGESYKVKGVTIETVPALHPNQIKADMIGGELESLLSNEKLSAYAGPATGYVLTFSNNLVVYLSGDTGITTEHFRQHYKDKAKLVVMNINIPRSTGPKEAAWIINELIKPVSVIASHAREVATIGGKLRTDINTKTGSFKNTIKNAKVYVPLSGKTMEFDSGGNCVTGC